MDRGRRGGRICSRRPGQVVDRTLVGLKSDTILSTAIRINCPLYEPSPPRKAIHPHTVGGPLLLEGSVVPHSRALFLFHVSPDPHEQFCYSHSIVAGGFELMS